MNPKEKEHAKRPRMLSESVGTEQANHSGRPETKKEPTPAAEQWVKDRMVEAFQWKE